MRARLYPSKSISLVALALACGIAHSQQADPAPPSQVTVPAAPGPQQAAPNPFAQAPATPAARPPLLPKNVKPPTGSERRRAAKLYLAATRLFEKSQFEDAFQDYQQAVALDPTNTDYPLALEVTRSHAVTSLIQTAAQDRTRGDTPGARAALARAHDLDPQNPQVAQHLGELGLSAVADSPSSSPVQDQDSFGGMVHLEPTSGRQSFHVRTNQRDLLKRVFSAYGIDAAIDESVRAGLVRLDVDDASFAEAARVVEMVTGTFKVPIDAHRTLVAKDSRENRQQFTRNGVETVYLAGMTNTEMTDMGNMARNVFEMNSAAVDATAGTLTLRAPESKLNAFNATLRSLADGRSQVLLDVRLIQLAHTSTRNTGAQLPQQVTAFNVYAEEQSILNANQALVQQIISSGLAAPGDTLTILGILLASGQVSSSLLSNGVVLFGGGLTLSGVTPQPLTFNLDLNSSDSRELDLYQLRLGDGEEGTLRSGTRYPIESSSFSSLGSGGLNIPGLTGAGTSGSLSSILSSLGGASTTIPQVQYQDLGLTLKATPRIMRSGDVALTIDMKISALAGSSLNGVPVLANRAWSGVVTTPQNQAVVVASEMDKQETRALSGTPGLTEIPGLNNITDKDVQKNYSSLLIVITPHVLRGPRTGDHTQMVRIERNLPTR